MSIYLGKDKQNEKQMMTTIYIVMKRFHPESKKGRPYIVFYIVNFLTSDFFDGLCMRAVKCCGILRQNCKGILGGGG
jgi:hypothetical protein